MRPHPIVLTLPVIAMAGCDFILPGESDDDDGDAAVVVDTEGTVYRLSGNVDSASLVWTGSVDAGGSAASTVVGGVAAVGAGSMVSAFDLDTGDPLWTVSVVDQVVSMTSGGGAVYALGFTALTAIDVAEGVVLWTRDFTDEGITGVSFAVPVHAAGGVVLGGDPVRLYDVAGSIAGTHATGDDEMLGLAAASGRVYAGSRAGLVALDGTDLSEQWSVATTAEVDRVTATSAGIAYSRLGGGVSGVSASGTALWEDADGAVYEGLVSLEDVLVGVRLQGSLHAWGAADGSPAWTIDDALSPVRGLGTSGSTVFFAGGRALRGIDPIDGEVLWEWSPSADPVSLAVP